MTFEFQPFDESFYLLLPGWLFEPHVREWRDEGEDNLGKVMASHSPEEGLEQFIDPYPDVRGRSDGAVDFYFATGATIDGENEVLFSYQL